MGKLIPDARLDIFLDAIANECTRVTICSTQPTTYTEANATYALADVTVTAGVGNGDFTKGNGDTNGRKLTLLQQTGVTVDADGTAAHIALLDVAGSELLAVTTCTSQVVTTGNTATINAFDIEISDAS
jgi:hypothetical protein